mmetsp:Transcript_4510/g.13668  ORF Transcript_4510/g.13668 Transcript_4510/m.13668 type:complete len:135 (-) Transcript_4510:52-456(-)
MSCLVSEPSRKLLRATAPRQLFPAAERRRAEDRASAPAATAALARRRPWDHWRQDDFNSEAKPQATPPLPEAPSSPVAGAAQSAAPTAAPPVPEAVREEGTGPRSTPVSGIGRPRRRPAAEAAAKADHTQSAES